MVLGGGRLGEERLLTVHSQSLEGDRVGIECDVAAFERHFKKAWKVTVVGRSSATAPPF